MARTILPSGEELNVTPSEVLRYINPDGLRQMMRQERLRWNLKANKDCDYYDNQSLFKYSGELHNEGKYQKMEIRTYPDNNAYAGYAGIYNDSGLNGLLHDIDRWDKAISPESLNEKVNRVLISASAEIPDKLGCGLSYGGNMVKDTDRRMAALLLDPYDGRAYLYSNDDTAYVNNETRAERLPDRTVARVGDIPTRITQLKNDLDFVSDPDYHHTDNNFTNSNRYVLDNIDDRTFVYPEVSRDKSGDYIENYRVGLNGDPSYGEADGTTNSNTQPDLGQNPDLGDYGDRFAEAVSSYNHNKGFCNVNHRDGYLPGIFRSVEELERVDLVDQIKTPLTHKDTPGGRRSNNYYIHDGVWSSDWFDRDNPNESYMAPSLNPNNMELDINGVEPTPYSRLPYEGDEPFQVGDLYQWRYNRVSLKYFSDNISIHIVETGEQYKVGDVLRWTFGDDVFLYEVRTVGPNGQIQSGSYKSERKRTFEQNPSTHGIGISFSNMSGVGYGAKLEIKCRATITTHATQIKNNLYAYVDITPTVRSDNSTPWSDINEPDTQGDRIRIRSTAAGPGYTGINSGRGGPISTNMGKKVFYEHGGNATAGVHVHLFKYVIDTHYPVYVERDGIKVYLGKWVDQGPMGVERPCDIKALFLSNYDTNNFNNYYKFMLDTIVDSMKTSPDAIVSNNANAVSRMYIHKDQKDPTSETRFTETQMDPETSELVEVDITDNVLYTNVATGVSFMYNSGYKNDPTFGYGMRPPGWFALAGSISR